MGTSGTTAMPRSILRVSICNFNLVFEPHMQTNGNPAPIFLSGKFDLGSFNKKLKNGSCQYERLNG